MLDALYKTLFRSLLAELGLVIRTLVKLLCYNVSVSYLVVNPVEYYRSKHIKIDYHFVWEPVAHGDLVIRFVPIELQIADIFTKRFV